MDDNASKVNGGDGCLTLVLLFLILFHSCDTRVDVRNMNDKLDQLIEQTKK